MEWLVSLRAKIKSVDRAEGKRFSFLSVIVGVGSVVVASGKRGEDLCSDDQEGWMSGGSC